MKGPVTNLFPGVTKSWERVIFFSFKCPFAGSVVSYHDISYNALHKLFPPPKRW